jgi:Large polyvalent protein-associated domain 11
MAQDKFNYMMLSRLQMDCEYFLGYGKRCVCHLWANTVEEHISEMKRLYGLVPVNPEWLSMEDILDFESRMV